MSFKRHTDDIGLRGGHDLSMLVYVLCLFQITA